MGPRQLSWKLLFQEALCSGSLWAHSRADHWVDACLVNHSRSQLLALTTAGTGEAGKEPKSRLWISEPSVLDASA